MHTTTIEHFTPTGQATTIERSTTTGQVTTTDNPEGTIAGRLRASWLLDGAGQLTLVWEVAGSSPEWDDSNPSRIASATAAARSETPSLS